MFSPSDLNHDTQNSMKYFIGLLALFLSSCQRNEAHYFYEQGNEAYISQDYASSLDFLNKAIQLKPDFATAYYTRGNAYYSVGNYAKAIADYSSAIKYNPDYAISYRFRGVVKCSTGDTLGALNDWQAAIRLGDNRARHFLSSCRKHR